MNEYLEKLNCKQSKINVKPLEEYARKNQIPIIEYESLMIIFSLIKAKKVLKILEIVIRQNYEINFCQICLFRIY